MKSTVFKLKPKIQGLKLRKYFHSLWDWGRVSCFPDCSGRSTVCPEVLLYRLTYRDRATPVVVPGPVLSVKVMVEDGKNMRRVCGNLLLPPPGGTSPAEGLWGVSESFFWLLYMFENFHHKLLRGNKKKRNRDLWSGFCLRAHPLGISGLMHPYKTSTQKCLAHLCRLAL